MEEACKSLKLVRFFIFFSAKFFFSQIFLRGEGLSHRFHRYTQIFFIMIFLHRISRMIGGILAYRITHGFSQNFGRWPMARALYMLLLFFVTQISLMTQIFLRGDYFFPQISQIYTDFFHHDFSSSDFTDESEGILVCRITHGFSRNFGRWPMARALYMLLLFFVTQISLMTQIFLRWRVLSHRFHRFTQIFYGISGESLCPISGGYLQRPDRSHLRKSVSNRLSSQPPNKFREIR